MEQNITSMLIARALSDINFVNVDFDFYKKLHNYVFSDIYEWAGEIRKVNISKQATNFCSAENIEKTSGRIFKRLIESNYLKDIDKKDFVNEFTDLYCDLNYLHPFREGNGRIQRLFLVMLLRDMGKDLDFSAIDKDLLMIATIKSVSGDVFMLRDIFNEFIK